LSRAHVELSGDAVEVTQRERSEVITSLTSQLRRSLAWDQGKEMAEHARFSVATGAPVVRVLAGRRADNPAPRPD
jgi:IS30 family transposase